MRNLKVVDQNERYIPIDGVRHMSIDLWSRLTTFTTNDCVGVWDESKLFTLSGGINGEFIRCEPTEPSEVCIVTTCGLYTWQYSDNQIVADFSVPTGIKCINFSPEKSLLAFITGDAQVSLVTSALEFQASFDLKKEDFGIASPVTVGWGKKETQFHGSAGKEAAVAKPQPILNSSQHDDGRFEIAWREDGKYFAVSWPDPSVHNCRRIRVFTESGELFSTSEPNGQMEHGLCWRPRIQLITSVQRRPSRGLDVIFFETNSERHGDFELLNADLETKYRVEQMQFDPSGDLLAVLFTPLVDNPSEVSFIRLLTSSSYHWYAKRDLSFVRTSTSGPGVAFCWTYDSGLSSLHVAIPWLTQKEDGSSCMRTLVRRWTWSLMYDGCDCLTSGSNTYSQPKTKYPGVVGVIDGDTALFTALAHTLIPPPMFATRLSLKTTNADRDARGCRLVSLSFPGPWVREVQTAVCLPVLVQFESELMLVSLNCGASETRQHTIQTSIGSLEAQWVCGAQHTVPWPVKATPIRLAECMKTSDNPDVESLLTDSARFVPLGGSEISHFCWIDLEHVVFLSCSGHLVGLLSFSDTLEITTGRWLLALNSTVVTDTNIGGKDVHIRGVCNTPGQLLCVQLSDARVFLYDIQKLLDAVDCLSIDFVQQGLDETDQSTSGPLYWILRLPVACEQWAAIRFTEATTDRARSKPYASQLNPNNANRQCLLAVHQSSHRLYAAMIPTPEDRTRLAFQLGEQKPITCAMDLCSSLLVLPNYLLVTSMRKVLICVSTELRPEILIDGEACLMELISRLDVPAELISNQPTKSQNWYDDFLHPVETGAILVRAPPDDTKVVLQMPRGNLEEVHPRALVLSHLSSLLDNNQYAEALGTMRRHRVSLNLLHDHNPSVFCANLNTFLNQLTNPEPIILFISELTEEDVSETIYGKFYGRGASQSVRGKISQKQQTLLIPVTKKSKVNTVCDALLKVMKDVKRYLLPILTCYAKKSPPELQIALMLLKKYHDDGEINIWESGARHLQYFATPLELYRVALGTYDLNLALLMARRTQLDPKEYLAQLNEIQAITDLDDSEFARAYQRFHIDNHLQRYASAVRHLYESGANHLNEIIEYIRVHKLYREALELFQSDSDGFKVVSRMWAEHLVSEQKLSLSGEVYLRAGLFAAAARTFLSTNQTQLWMIAVTQAKSVDAVTDDLVHLHPSEVKLQAIKLAARLRDLGRYQEALDIYLNFLQNPDIAIEVGLEGGLWIQSRNLAVQYDKMDSFERSIRPKLVEAVAVLIEQVLNTNEQFTNLVQRLIGLRLRHENEAESKRLARLHGQGDPMDDTATETDLFSDTSSISDSSMSGSIGGVSLRSTYSRKSGRSTKNKRKQEARKWSSKVGSKYEEIGLLKEITQSIELGQRLAGEASSLVLELWREGFAKEGARLLFHINQLITNQKSNMSTVWDDWITGKIDQVDERLFEGRKRYPFQEPFMVCAPEMKITRVNCQLLQQHE
ncbi:Elongator complex protein 1 [Fasciola hepatica]|uniref:Elongator complex protein 1 n=1 Tax=Fasciola hepatica TaxID=6192 RepID=A0A4E0R0N5_FASHE|nr:Elongator complex protein 1 [Fasciola hepatica]